MRTVGFLAVVAAASVLQLSGLSKAFAMVGISSLVLFSVLGMEHQTWRGAGVCTSVRYLDLP